jgi:uncharacterized membrane protein YeaQ/YmgE (transglycosylase-associated protein family)
MSWIVWIVLGLIAGLIAKLLMPGRDPGGFIVTAILGIVGALIGGFISTRLGFGDVTGLNLPSIIVAAVGSIVLLVIYRLFARKSSGTPRV